MTELRAGSATDVGRTRQINQDTPLVADDAGLWAVADGMGGHRGGEVASAVAIETLLETFSGTAANEESLLDAATAANTAVFAAADEDPNLRGMGTTLVAIARTDDDELAIVNVGDSRIYLMRDDVLDRLTSDHSLVEEMVREGTLTPEEAKVHPKRNIVTRALGIEPWVRVDSDTIVPYVGDRYLLCSDGLFGEVDDARISSVLRRLADPGEAAAELVRLANENGGRDNITVVIVDVVDDGDRAGEASKVVPTTTGGRADLAGFTTAVDPEASDAAGADTPPARISRRERRRQAPRSRRVTLRVVGFFLLLVVVLGGAAIAIGQYARNTYYVGLQDDGTAGGAATVAIFRGKPDGVLWFDPTFERSTGLVLTDLRPEARDAVTEGIEFGSLDEAQEYLVGVTTTTTAPTTTTTPTTRPTTTTRNPTTVPATLPPATLPPP